ncbi:HisA/HisF-related TIM barrel protein [Sphingobacterium spiritivorum]|uniref:HisA/HisF-related TIM barrel protein n=1 Tax=Sphingobacterium spiritivorum TaxID=258 RepID=UPI003DA5CE62
MLRKRVIFTLLYCDGFFMQSRNFRLQKVGDVNWLEKFYKFNKIAFSLDELVILNVSRKSKNQEEFGRTVSRLVEGTYMPVAVGGGIRSLEDAEMLFKSGADKIVLNTSLSSDPDLVKLIVQKYGSQSVVASIDYLKKGESNEIFIENGSLNINEGFENYLSHLKDLNVGEVYLNSMERDGTGFGYDFSLVKLVKSILNVPLIIAGGAGNEGHLKEALLHSEISAAATANLFNFIGDGLPKARIFLINSGENLANWDVIKGDNK